MVTNKFAGLTEHELEIVSTPLSKLSQTTRAWLYLSFVKAEEPAFLH
jgi:hypothetical protein